MTGKRFTCGPNAAANGPAFAARADNAKANNANTGDPKTLVERVNAYGFDADRRTLHVGQITTSGGAA